jgi:hypothetical protein
MQRKVQKAAKINSQNFYNDVYYTTSFRINIYV